MEAGFQIEGAVYPVPELSTFTMDEAQVLWDYSGLCLEDFVEVEHETDDERRDRERARRNPGFMRALMHVAYQRRHPKIPAARVKQLIAGAKVVDQWEGISVDEPEDDAVPPAETLEPSRPSGNGSAGSSVSSGSGSPPDSSERDATLPSIGATR